MAQIIITAVFEDGGFGSLSIDADWIGANRTIDKDELPDRIFDIRIHTENGTAELNLRGNAGELSTFLIRRK